MPYGNAPEDARSSKNYLGLKGDARSITIRQDTKEPNGAKKTLREKAMATKFPLIEGKNGAVGTGTEASAKVGLEILKRGGNAVDAGVAMVISLSVTHGKYACFGGEMPALVYLAKEKRVVVIAGQGPAPRAYGKRPTPPPAGKAAVPGQFDACLLALQQYGKMRAADVIEPTIHLAERKESPDWQKDLARTLRQIVAAEKRAGALSEERGIQAARDYFYRGPVAKAIVKFSEENGGIFAENDFSKYSAKIEPPVHAKYRGYDVYKAGPWTQGPALLQALNILEGFDLKAMGHNSAKYIHTIMQAMSLAFADRDTFYGDPDFCRVPLKQLLSKEYAAVRRKLMGEIARHYVPPGDPERLGPMNPKGDPRVDGSASPSQDTSVSVAIDSDRNVFCGTPSGWGSDIPMGDTGVTLGTRLVSFWPGKGHPNEARGGKRPRITLTPTIVLKNGQPFLAISVAGGDKQDQTALNILLNVIEFGMDAQEAAEAPRVSTLHHTDSFNPGGIVGEGVLEIQEGVPDATIGELEAMGYKVRRRFLSIPAVILNKEKEGIVQAGAREAHAGVRAW